MTPRPPTTRRRLLPRTLGRMAIRGALVAPALFVTAISSDAASATTKTGVISAVGAESEYANVLSQLGGKYVSVSSILNNPNTDPHTYEASPSVAQAVSHA
ncbi:MAG TPA: hypothetical protein VNF05_07455, partial [Acidimicrobiales bacterium]|nr:hypothetical protein [Acidimicrobiales bacterium]